MTRAHLPGSFRNSSKVVHIDTHRVTLTEMESTVAYPIEDMRQGRDSQTPVPRFSMLAGKPAAKFELSLHQRAMTAAVAAMAVLAFILAVWPN